jgi:hypothetical protein
MDLSHAALTVESRTDLAKFLAELRADLSANPAAWENSTLGSFLAALASWLEDTEAHENFRRAAVPSWTTFAQMLVAARMYE